jgi:SOS-response transcriptional repressor LexA
MTEIGRKELFAMSAGQLSDKQLEIYEFVVDFTRREGFPPSVREIGAAVACVPRPRSIPI